MYQKQEIVIDKNSPEAVKFYNETMLPYIKTITSSKLICHKLDDDGNIAETSERKVYSDIKTGSDEKHIKITTEENWEELYVDYGMAQYYISVPEDKETKDLTSEDIDFSKMEVVYPNAPDAVEGDPTEFDISRIFKAYKDNEAALKDVCSIRIVRGIDAQGENGSRVECWGSGKTDDFVFSSSDCFNGAAVMKNGRTISLEELPDTCWTGLSPVFSMERLTGNEYVDPSSEMPRYEKVMDQMTHEEYLKKWRSYPRPFERPVSDELAAEFEEEPEWVDELGDRIRYEFNVYDDIFFRDTEIEYCTVVYDAWGTESFNDVSTEAVVDHLSAVEELFRKLEEQNGRFFKKEGIGDYDTCHAHMLFYSKDFAMFEAYYDVMERKMIYTFYDECFGK